MNVLVAPETAELMVSNLSSCNIDAIVNPAVIAINATVDWNRDVVPSMQKQELGTICAGSWLKVPSQWHGRFKGVPSEVAIQFFVNCREEHAAIRAASCPNLSVVNAEFLLYMGHQIFRELHIIITGAPRADVALVQLGATEGAVILPC